MTDAEVLGRRLRAQRTTLGLTLAEVAGQADLSLPYLSNLERGRGNPTIDALGKIAGALGTTVGSLVGKTDVSGEEAHVEELLGTPPDSLVRFLRTAEFEQTVERLAKVQEVSPDDMRRRLVTSMSTAPRRSNGEPTETDWRRLIDTYSLILGAD